MQVEHVPAVAFERIGAENGDRSGDFGQRDYCYFSPPVPGHIPIRDEPDLRVYSSHRRGGYFAGRTDVDTILDIAFRPKIVVAG